MLDRGVWHQYLLHVKFSNNAGVGFQETYRDGQLVLPKTSSKYANMTTPEGVPEDRDVPEGNQQRADGGLARRHDRLHLRPGDLGHDDSGPAVTSSIQILPAGQPDDVMLTGHVN